MKTFLISAVTILMVVIIYFLFFSTSGSEATRTAESKTKRANDKLVANKTNQNIMNIFSNKLSMKQIDSITAQENYYFSSKNYVKDVVPADSAELKNKKKI